MVDFTREYGLAPGVRHGHWTVDHRLNVAKSIAIEPDPSWVHVDAKGHVHRWVGDEVPSTKVNRMCGWWHRLLRALYHGDYGCDCYSVRVCKECEEEIAPLTRQVTLIAAGAMNFSATVEVETHNPPIDRNELMAGAPIDIGRFFSELSGECYVDMGEGSIGYHGDITETIAIIGVGTIEWRKP